MHKRGTLYIRLLKINLKVKLFKPVSLLLLLKLFIFEKNSNKFQLQQINTFIQFYITRNSSHKKIIKN